MEEDFPATIKVITGEEVFAIVQPHKEDDKEFLILYSPVIMKEIALPNGSSVLKIEPWLKSCDDDIFILERKNVVILSECRDNEMISYHKKFIQENRKGIKKNPYEETLTREQGYVSNVKEMKERLEKLFRCL